MAPPADGNGYKAGEVNFAVLLGALRELLASKRQVLGHLALIAVDGRPEPAYSHQMEAIAWQVFHVEGLAQLLEKWLPHEGALRALAQFNMLPMIQAYRPFCIASERLPDGCPVLIRGSMEADYGAECSVTVMTGQTGPRHVNVVRSEIVGVGC